MSNLTLVDLRLDALENFESVTKMLAVELQFN